MDDKPTSPGGEADASETKAENKDPETKEKEKKDAGGQTDEKENEKEKQAEMKNKRRRWVDREEGALESVYLGKIGTKIKTVSKEKSFGTSQSRVGVCKEGKYYYEILLETENLMQLGFGTKEMTASCKDGTGVGDDEYGWAIDLYRVKCWHNGKDTDYGRKKWQIGDRIGCGINLDDKCFEFWLNGESLGKIYQTNINYQQDRMYYPSVTLLYENEIHVSFEEKDYKFGVPQGYQSFDKPNEIFSKKIKDTYTNKEMVDAVCDDMLSALNNKDIKRFTESFEVVSDEKLLKKVDSDLNYVFNIKKYGVDERPLLVSACIANSPEIIKTLLTVEALDVNNTDKHGKTAIYMACHVGNLEVVKLLLEKGADPNILPTLDGSESTMIKTAYKGNRDIMKELLNLDGKYKYTFDWNKLINYCKSGGTNVFHICCQGGFISCLKFLFRVEKEEKEEENFQTKIDIWARNAGGNGGLHLAANSNSTKTVKYLLSEVYTDKNTGKYFSQFDINGKFWSQRNLFYTCCIHGNLEIIKLLIDEFGDEINIDQPAQRNLSPFWVLCEKNRFRCVSYLLKNKALRERIDLNRISQNGVTPLMIAAANGHYECVNLLCTLCPDLKIEDLRYENTGKNAIEWAVQRGHIPVFSKLILTLFDRYNITNMETLKKKIRYFE